MALIVKRKLNQTWRDAVARRIGESAGSALLAFDEAVSAGQTEAEAAYRVVAEAGRLWHVDESGRASGGDTAEVPPA